MSFGKVFVSHKIDIALYEDHYRVLPEGTQLTITT